MHYSPISAAVLGARFTVDVAAMQEAVAFLASSIVERRNTIPILSNVLIVARDDGMVKVSGTDLDCEATFTLRGQVESPGAFTVGAYALADFLKSAKGTGRDELHVTYSDGKVQLRNSRANVKLHCLPRDDFPIIARPESVTTPLSWQIDAATLSAELAVIAPYISTEETRYYLNGISFEREGGKLIAVATNGHGMAIVERESEGPDIASRLMPRKVVAALRKLAKRSDAFDIELTAAKGRAVAGNVELYFKLIDGTFPDWRRVYPASTDKALTVAADELAKHCKLAKPLGVGHSAKYRPLTLELHGAGLRAGQATYATPLSGEYSGDDLTIGVGAVWLEPVAALGGTISIGMNANDAPMTLRSDAMPNARWVAMPFRLTDGLPEPVAVTYPAVTAAPGRAADLFAVESMRNAERVKPGPRAATSKEQEAYLLDYAKRCGLPIMEKRNLVANGLTFGLIKDKWTEYHKRTDKWGYEHNDMTRDPIAHHPAQYAEGAYSIPMPGRKQAPVTVETLGDDGTWSAPMPCTDAKGSIAMPDQPKERKARAVKPKVSKRRRFDGKGIDPAYIGYPVSHETPAPEIAPQTPQDVQEAVCATLAAPKPEIASTGSERAELTPADALPDIDAIMARLDAVESAVAELPRIRMKAIAVRMDEAEPSTPSSVENGTDAGDAGNVIAWPGARAMHGDRAAADAERKARERAKRERLVRRYLAMRKERSQWRRLAENGADERQALRKSRDDFESLSIRTANVAACQGEKRRRAVTLARDLQKRLNAEHRLVEHYSEKHRKACEHNRRLNNELAALKAKLECPSTPDRVSDVAMLRAENSAMRDELAMVKADRDRLAAVADNHAGAISALVDRIARAEAAMRRAGIAAGPVAVAA